VSILLIEDDRTYSRTLARALASRGYAVVVAANVKEGREHALAGDVELILLDRGLPDGDGIDFCAAMRAQGLAVPILILTGRDELTDQVAGYRAGADEYVVKSAHVELLCAKISAHLRPKPVDRRRVGPITVDETAAAVFVDGRRIRVTPTEYSILSTLALHVDQPLDGDHLAAIVWGPTWKLERGALYTNISRLRTKLGKVASAHLSTLRRGKGWVLRSVPEPPATQTSGVRRTAATRARRGA
jgi:DNA-binding response OmpR family regulator